MDRTEHLRLRSDLAALRFQLALLRLEDLELKYSSDQPRVPSGSPEGGRWTDDGAGDAASAANDPPALDDGVFRPKQDGTAEIEVVAAVKPSPIVDIQQEDKQGGHTVDHLHVAVPNGLLMKTLEGERFDTPAMSFYKAAHGSYDGMGSANAHTNDVLQSYPSRVAAVASGVNQEDFLEKRYSSPTGRESYRMTETENSAISIRPTYSAGVLTQAYRYGEGVCCNCIIPQELRTTL